MGTVVNVSWRLLGLLAIGLVALVAVTPALAGPPGPPAVSVPPSLIAEPQTQAGAVVSFQPRGTDWKGRPVAVACEPSSASLFPLGLTQVSCTATDRREQSTTASFPVAVEHLYQPRERRGVTSFRKLRFAWYPAAGAQPYNLQLWRRSVDGWAKIASVFPDRENFLLPRSWRHQGHRYRLRKGTYRWYVWPWLGSRYGPVLGRNTFFVRQA